MIIEHKGKRGSSFYVRVNGPEGNKFYGEPIREWECPGGKREAKRLAKKREAETTVRYITNQPIDHHADAMDATRYVLMGMLRGGAERQDAQKNANRYKSSLGRVRA